MKETPEYLSVLYKYFYIRHMSVFFFLPFKLMIALLDKE